MCMGKTHVIAGYPWGVLVASALGMPPAVQIASGLVSAGASALNDLDCKGASAARVLGPVSDLLSWLVRLYAAAIYHTTRGEGDDEDAGTHRKATHAVPIIVLVQTPLLLAMPYIVEAIARSLASLRQGADAELIGHWAGAGFVAAVIGFCLLMVLDRLGTKFLAAAAVVALVAGGLSVDLSDPAGQLWAMSPWVVLMVLAGTVCHVVFDEITEGGTPFAAPIFKRDTRSGPKRWVMIRLPEILAIETGKKAERWGVYPLCLIAAVLVTPVIGPWVIANVLPVLMGMGQDAYRAF